MTSKCLNVGFNALWIDFVDVKGEHYYNENLVCRYELNDYQVKEGDRIAIFRIGWQYVKDYELFEWVSKDNKTNCVTFNKHCLPKNVDEVYQFCFISGENNLHGASQPFKFTNVPGCSDSMFSSVMNKSNLYLTENYKSISSCSSLDSSNVINIMKVTSKDEEVLKLREENQLLRSTLKAVISNDGHNSCKSDIENLKKITRDLQMAFDVQQSQIKHLSMKMVCSSEINKMLLDEKKELENTCSSLKQQLGDITKLADNAKFEVGELDSLPPFPFAK